ncbi:type VII secretion protein EccB [Corynebacterium sp. 3HC-13]|uniref:type VII secretion protein EccB n=1 Tax=Corynebacterium poyangense TaxID=2684405 RepID=UPI001CC992CF|nr:type VII secretion protein EccB [Corynebacterium poyangense]MBZ8176750.1 type VII secretion protein EccB [Corynebacterium poyangense]
MAEPLISTSSAQVSGHRFLKRRVEHALVLGDARMIHDPLGRRQRAALFGFIAALLLGLGAGALAVLQPAIDPGEAPILRSDSGALFVRVGPTVHPVSNLASARLIIGSPADPVTISDEVLLQEPMGSPIGIPDAPGVFANHPISDLAWSVCQESAGDIVVSAKKNHDASADNEAVLVRQGEEEWLVDALGRRKLPDPASVEGRAVRRNLGIDSATPRWQPPEALLNAATELPAISLPPGVVLHTGDGGYWLEHEGKIRFLSGVQSAILIDAGREERHVSRGYPAQQPDSLEPEVDLPRFAPTWLDPADNDLCFLGEGGLQKGKRSAEKLGVRLAGDSLAQRYIGAGVGAIGIKTGGGLYLIAEWGGVHQVVDQEAAEALGLSEENASSVPWTIIRLLAQGSALGRSEIPLLEEKD